MADILELATTIKNAADFSARYSWQSNPRQKCVCHLSWNSVDINYLPSVSSTLSARYISRTCPTTFSLFSFLLSFIFSIFSLSKLSYFSEMATSSSSSAEGMPPRFNNAAVRARYTMVAPKNKWEEQGFHFDDSLENYGPRTNNLQKAE
ncbi:hypothetical protein V6N13_103524 [Hibiscus sabdariffa]